MTIQTPPGAAPTGSAGTADQAAPLDALLADAAEMAGLVAAFLSGDNRPSHPLTDPST